MSVDACSVQEVFVSAVADAPTAYNYSDSSDNSTDSDTGPGNDTDYRLGSATRSTDRCNASAGTNSSQSLQLIKSLLSAGGTVTVPPDAVLNVSAEVFATSTTETLVSALQNFAANGSGNGSLTTGGTMIIGQLVVVGSYITTPESTISVRVPQAFV